jgi:indole-3-glycerol phosphate synthase
VQAAAWSTPTGTLGTLVADAHRRAEAMLSREPELAAAAARAPAALPLASALRGAQVGVIAEVKRRSPSKGSINPGLDAGRQAVAYERGGAAAISVLTEPSRFGGSTDDLVEVVAAVRVPVLKKDFHVHPVQLLEAKALGASAALLIVRALSPEQLQALSAGAREIGLETIVEIRDEAELERALAAHARIIGINNRNLETLEIDTATSRRLLPLIPAHVVAVAESGMRTVGDIEAVARAGADAVLVGSFISAAPDPIAAVRELSGVTRAGRRG